MQSGRIAARRSAVGWRGEQSTGTRQSVATGRERGRYLYETYAKRVLDLMIAIPLLLVLSLIIGLIAIAVWRSSPGPVMFRQQRIGRGGRPFTVLKFRTMAAEAGPTFRQFVGADGSAKHKIPNDPRVTRVGRFLRRTSLDELPQLFNVLRGEMSMIGPRPELPEIVSRYEAWQHRRHEVRPGLTGWWQINRRGDGLMCEHTELDIYYVDNVSLRLDLRILLRTFNTVLSGKGAF